MNTVLLILAISASALADQPISDVKDLDADYWKLYLSGFKLQDKVLALKKAAVVLQQVPAGVFDNVGFLPQNPNAAYLPIPVVAPQRPSFPDFKVPSTDPILKVLNQLLKRQEEILKTFEVPAVVEEQEKVIGLKNVVVEKPAASGVEIPEGTRVEIIAVDIGGAPFVPSKPYVQSKSTYDTDKTLYDEVEVPAAVLDMLY